MAWGKRANLEDSKIRLSKWLLAIHEVCANENGISSLELARKLDIAQKSAWFMAHRIRYAIAHPPSAFLLGGTVEADETYFGGKLKNMHKPKRDLLIHTRGKVGKVAVFTIVERNGEVRSQMISDMNGETVKQPLGERRYCFNPEHRYVADLHSGWRGICETRNGRP